jgi:hypothetical protein
MKKSIILVLAIIQITIVHADMITKVSTIRTMDAITRQFIDKTKDIKQSAGALKGMYACMKKNKDQTKCIQRKCATIDQCLLTIFQEFERILNPILQDIVGTLDAGSGKLKPGVLTALPSLWDDPKPDTITKMQNILLYDIAVPLNNISAFIKVLSDSLDPSVKAEDKTIPVAVDAAQADSMNLDQAPMPAQVDENATVPTEDQAMATTDAGSTADTTAPSADTTSSDQVGVSTEAQAGS